MIGRDTLNKYGGGVLEVKGGIPSDEVPPFDNSQCTFSDLGKSTKSSTQPYDAQCKGLGFKQ